MNDALLIVLYLLCEKGFALAEWSQKKHAAVYECSNARLPNSNKASFHIDGAHGLKCVVILRLLSMGVSFRLSCCRMSCQRRWMSTSVSRLFFQLSHNGLSSGYGFCEARLIPAETSSHPALGW